MGFNITRHPVVKRAVTLSVGGNIIRIITIRNYRQIHRCKIAKNPITFPVGQFDRTIADYVPLGLNRITKGIDTHRSYWVRAVAVFPDGAAVVTGSYDNTARIWDAATGAGRVFIISSRFA